MTCFSTEESRQDAKLEKVREEQERQKNTGMAWSMVLPAGGPMRTLHPTSTGISEQCDSDENGKPDHEQPPERP